MRDNVQMKVRWAARFVPVNSKNTKNASVRGQDRCRPTCSKAVKAGQFTVFVPERISLDIGNDDLLLSLSSRATRAHGGPDLDPVDEGDEFLGKARRCSPPKATGRIDQQY